MPVQSPTSNVKPRYMIAVVAARKRVASRARERLRCPLSSLGTHAHGVVLVVAQRAGAFGRGSTGRLQLRDLLVRDPAHRRRDAAVALSAPALGASLDKAMAAPHPRAMAEAAVETRVELIVVGGRLVGLPLAIRSADAGIEVAVIDREDPRAMLAEPFDGRTTA